MLKTETPATYWNEQGKYQADYNSLWRALVPDSGRAGTTHGELLRAISRIYHDVYNNGFGNGPFTEEWSTLQNWSEELGSELKRFGCFFKRTNLGEEVIEEDEWEGDEAVEKLVDKVIQVVKKAHAERMGA